MANRKAGHYMHIAVTDEQHAFLTKLPNSSAFIRGLLIAEMERLGTDLAFKEAELEAELEAVRTQRAAQGGVGRLEELLKEPWVNKFLDVCLKNARDPNFYNWQNFLENYSKSTVPFFESHGMNITAKDVVRMLELRGDKFEH